MIVLKGHGGAMVTDFACHLLRSAVQTPDLMWESCWLLTDGRQFTVQNLDQLYVLVSSAHKTTCRDHMTCILFNAS